MAVYCESFWSFTTDGNLVDGFIAVGNCAEQDFAGLEFRWFCSSRLEYFFYDVLGCITEDLHRRYCTGALARHYRCESIHKKLKIINHQSSLHIRGIT